VGPKGVEVVTRWQDAKSLGDEMKKHRSFSKALRNCPFQFKITPIVSGGK